MRRQDQEKIFAKHILYDKRLLSKIYKGLKPNNRKQCKNWLKTEEPHQRI